MIAEALEGIGATLQKLVSYRGDPFSSPWTRAWRATSWFLKNIPEENRGGLVIEALRETKALSVAMLLIHLNDPADHKDAADFIPALDLSTVEAMKAIWLQLIRSRAAEENALLAEPDLASLLDRWQSYSGSIDEPRKWLLNAIGTDQGFAIMASSMMSVGTSHTLGDRVGKVQHMFSRDTIETFIGLDVVSARCESINPADFPNHKLPLTTLRRHVEAWAQNEGEVLHW